jgi:hypothetical protein
MCAIRKSLSPKSPTILRKKLSFSESTKDDKIEEEETQRDKSAATSVLDICREIISKAGDQLKGNHIIMECD